MLTISFEIKQFADTETIVVLERAEQIRNQDVFIFFRSPVPALLSVNEHLMRLLQVVNAIARNQPKSIKVAFSYLPYARGEAEQGALTMFGTCLKALGVSAVYAVQLHDSAITCTFPVPLYDITLESVWASVIKQLIVKDDAISSWCIASPDAGGFYRAQLVAQLCGLPMVSIQKNRQHDGLPVVYGLQGDVEGKNVILIDDIVDTARTAVSASELLRAHGARDLYGCFVHGVFSVGASQRLQDVAFKHIFVTDTLEGIQGVVGEHTTIVSINYEIERQIKALNHGTSLQSSINQSDHRSGQSGSEILS